MNSILMGNEMQGDGKSEQFRSDHERGGQRCAVYHGKHFGLYFPFLWLFTHIAHGHRSFFAGGKQSRAGEFYVMIAAYDHEAQEHRAVCGVGIM